MSCRPSLLPSGNDSIVWIAHHLRLSELTPIMKLISQLVTMPVIIVVMGMAYWCWNKYYSRTLLYGLFLNVLVNTGIKGIVMECRPPTLLHLEKISDLSFSFPSGHTQISSFLWCGLAYYVRSKRLAIFYIIIAILIAFSRPYLGVHYIHDVVAGAMLGITILGLCILNDKEHILRLYSLPVWIQGALLLLFYVLCHIIIKNNPKLVDFGTAGLLGTWLGSQLEMRFVKFSPSTHPTNVISCALVGLGGAALIIRFGNLIGYPLQYGLLGLWLSFVTPWMVYRLMHIHLLTALFSFRSVPYPSQKLRKK